jgi:hypothetical protein
VRLVLQARNLVRGHAPENGLGAFRHCLDDDEVPEALQQVLHEPARIMTGLDHAVHSPENRSGISGGHSLNHVIKQGSVRVAKQRDGELVVQAVRARARHQLVKHRERVTDGTTAGADHQRQDPGCNRDVLLIAQQFQVSHQRFRRHQPEGVVVGAGTDGPDDFVRFRGGKDELDVFRRFFDDLQQGVEARGRDHVGLVNDEDLVAVPHRGVGGALAEVPGVVHTTVARGVDLDDVQ